jgi:threonine dehydrogenase-like Zn-dependent dehydrogenase
VLLGAGTIGLRALQAARAAGAGRVFIAAKYEHQHRAAQDLGATGVLSADPAERNRELGELVPLGADVVLDTVGSGAPGLAGSLDAVRKGGRVLLYGGYHQPTTADLGPVVFKEVTLIGSNCYGVFGRRRDFELALDLIRAGRVRVERLVTHRFPFEQIAEAFRVSADKSQGVIKAHLVFK